MNKITTIVSLAGIAGLVMLSPVTHPDTNNNNNSQPTCASSEKKWSDAIGTANEAKYQAAYEKCLSLNGVGSNCSKAADDLAKAKGKFGSACMALGLPSGVRECSESRQKCHTQSSSSNSEESSSSRSSKAGLIDLDVAKERLKYCPDMSAADQEKFEKQLDKAESRLKELKDKIPDLQNSIADAQSEISQKQADLKEKARDAASDYAKQMKDARRAADEKQKALVDQMSQLQAQVAATDAQMDQLEVADRDADLKRLETDAQIELNCNASASATVAKLQADALDLMKQNKYSRGGQASMLKNVGLSDRASWQRLAKKYKDWCMQSEGTVKSKDSANRVYKSALDHNAQTRSATGKQRTLLQQQLKQIKDPNGACGQVLQNADGSTNETEMCKAARQTAEDMQQLQVDYQTKQQGFAEEANRIQNDGANKIMAKQAQLAQAQRDLNDEQTRVDNLRSYLGMKLNDSNASSGGTKQAEELWTTASEWGASANAMDTCCAKGSISDHTACQANADDMRAAGKSPTWTGTPSSSTSTTPSSTTTTPSGAGH